MNKKFFLLNSLLNIIIIVFGIILFKNPTFGLYNTTLYFAIYFFAIGMISLLVYFLCRTKENEENLVLAIISVITAGYLFICNNNCSSSYLALAVIIFVGLFVCYKGYRVFKYKDTNSYKWFLELINTLAIFIIGALTILNIYKEISVQTLIFGYFFVSVGFIDLLEILIYFFIKSPYFKEAFKKINTEEKKQKSIFKK